MRRHYLDNIRWIVIVLVVIYHVIYMYNGVQPFGVIGPFHTTQYQDSALYLLYPWFMFILFVISGMSSRYCLETCSDREFIRNRTRKLLVPGTIGILAIGWIQGYYNMSISHAFDAIDISAIPKPVCYLIMSLSGIGVLWFIQILWVFSLILTLVRKIEKDKLYSVCGKCGLTALLLLTVLVYLSAQVLNTPVITVYRFGVYGTAYFIGYFILSHDAIIERLVRFRTPIGIASLILGVAYTTIYFGENYAEEPTINNALACAYAWLMTLATLAYMKARADNETVMTKLAAKMSWGLYVFHYLPLSMTAWYLHIYAPNLPVVAHYLLTGSAGFIGGALLYELVRRIPVLRWCVLGIRKERKNISGQI